MHQPTKIATPRQNHHNPTPLAAERAIQTTQPRNQKADFAPGGEKSKFYLHGTIAVVGSEADKAEMVGRMELESAKVEAVDEEGS